MDAAKPPEEDMEACEADEAELNLEDVVSSEKRPRSPEEIIEFWEHQLEKVRSCF